MSFRRTALIAALLLAGAALSQGAVAAPAAGSTLDVPQYLSGSADAGKSKSAVCAACHGADGNSEVAQFPKLAGQNAHYIVDQLEKFKSGKRQNAIMQGMAAPLSDEDMRDLAAYFSSQKVAPGVADDDLVKAGEALYRGGDAERGIPACMACHSPDGSGNPGAPYAHLAGQHADYIEAMLTAWQGGDVWGDTANDQIMPMIAKKLSKQDIAAVSSYIEGLHAAGDDKQ